jgi:anti-sigma factor RsiW
MPPSFSDQTLVRYLLGLLPEDQAEQLDEASVADDAVASRLIAIENDLIDDYVRNELDAGTRRRFECVYLASTHRRERVRFALQLLASVDRRAASRMRVRRGVRTAPRFAATAS